MGNFNDLKLRLRYKAIGVRKIAIPIKAHSQRPAFGIDVGVGVEQKDGEGKKAGRRENCISFQKKPVTLSQLRAKGPLPTNFHPTIEIETCKPDLNDLQHNITPSILCVILSQFACKSFILNMSKAC